MLSYRHSFHAGNFADVIKHLVLIEILEHLSKKDSPFDYIDSHAGAGLYNLSSEQSSKLQEYTQGVGRLTPAAWQELDRYFAILNKYNPTGKLLHYPGSPMIALEILRAKDRAWLFELHPTDCEHLARNTHDDERARVMRADGYQGLLSLLPPVSRRGLVLIDPPYEIKTDYEQILAILAQAYKKFSTGTYAIWYPVVERKRIDRLEAKLKDSGIRKIQRFELAVRADSRGMGMTAAGMIVINPPWMLREKMLALLPRLVECLSEDTGAFYRCDELVGE
ncbi:MAG: 23S rRNA (adenine(2030)-N(6))-methyltransferase RlmJ [Gammaproteobacteria bacterium]